ncbi:MAG: hypothetical protein AAFZ05_12875, partial [Pseudomonadota bacterium]
MRCPNFPRATLSSRRSAVAALAAVLASAGAPVADAAPCTRLPLSDVAFGKGPATEAARAKLEDYARDIAK